MNIFNQIGAEAVALSGESLIVNHLKEKKSFLERKDDYHKKTKPVLIFSGGAMLGIFGAGVGVALNYLGLTNAFDVVVGVSAGAANAAYFLADQCKFGLTIYLEELTRKEFYNPWRVWKMVNVDYVGEVLRDIKPLNIEAVRKSRSQFLVSATDAENGKGLLIDALYTFDLIELICGSCGMFVVYNKPRRILPLGISVLDGAMTKPLPVCDVIERYHPTDLFVILNRPLYERRDILPLVHRWYSTMRLQNFSPELKEVFWRGGSIYNESVDYCVSGEWVSHNVNLSVVAPRTNTVTRTTRDVNLLKNYARDGADQVLSAFCSELTHKQIDEIIRDLIP